jgi:hypothetical protein
MVRTPTNNFKTNKTNQMSKKVKKQKVNYSKLSKTRIQELISDMFDEAMQYEFEAKEKALNIVLQEFYTGTISDKGNLEVAELYMKMQKKLDRVDDIQFQWAK